MLSVTIVPGTTLAEGQTVTYTDFNLLGRPTIGLTGQVSTAQLENEAVTPLKTAFAGDGTELAVRDILIKRPRFNPRAYTGGTDAAKIAAAIAAAIAEGGGTITIDRDYTLDTLLAADANMPAGYNFLLWAYTATRVQLAFEFVRNARLINGRTNESGAPVVTLGMKGAFEDLVFDGGGFERSQQTRAAHGTFGVLLMEGSGGAAVKRARFYGTLFRNQSNGIGGAAKVLKALNCDFNYPIGHPNSAAVSTQEAVGLWTSTVFGTVEEVSMRGCTLDGCETGEVDPGGAAASVYGAYGLCDVKGLGVSIVDNRVKRVSGEGIKVRPRLFGESNPTVSAEHDVLIAENRISFDDLTGQTAQTSRKGIACYDMGATIAKNRVREAYWGIVASGGSSAWDPGNDLVTRPRKVSIEGNDIALAGNLKISNTGTADANERFGIRADALRRVSVQNNQVHFRGRTATGLTKYFLANGISLVVVDDAQVDGNTVSGPIDAAATAADFIMQAGLQMEFCRRVSVGLNFFRNLNVGLIGVGLTGSSITPADITIDRQEMTDVVWPYARMMRSENVGLSATSSLHKRLQGVGYRVRNQRTSFLCNSDTLGSAFAGGYVRVGSFLNGIFGKVKIWTEHTGREMVAVLDATYWNTGAAGDGHMVATGFYAQGTALVTKARLCVNAAPADRICHLDVYVAGLEANARVWVEVEGVGYNQAEGLWGAPVLPSTTLTGYTGENATGLKECEFQPGVTIADGQWNGGRLTIDNAQIWNDRVSPALWLKRGDPSSISDGVNL